MAEPASDHRPVPDPTELTDKAIAELKGQMEQIIRLEVGIIEERLRGNDRLIAQAAISNEKAIDKAERSTQETIRTNQDLNMSKIASLTSVVEDLKLEVRGITSRSVGAEDNRAGLYATIGVIVSLTFLAIALIGFVVTRLPV